MYNTLHNVAAGYEARPEPVPVLPAAEVSRHGDAVRLSSRGGRAGVPPLLPLRPGRQPGQQAAQSRQGNNQTDLDNLIDLIGFSNKHY